MTENANVTEPQANESKELVPKIRRTLSGEGGNSSFQTFFSLFKTFVGVGILFLPKGYLYGGWLFGGIALLLFASITLVGVYQLISLREEYQMTYSSIGETAYGLKFGHFVDILTFLSQDGFALSYSVFIIEHSNDLIKHWFLNANEPYPWLRWIIALIFFAIIYPLSLIRNTTKLSNVHFAADTVIIIVILYISIKSGTVIANATALPDGIRLFKLSTCMILLGMAAFSFEGIAVVIPLYKQLNNKSAFRYIFRTAIFLVCGIYIGFAHLNYLAYGSNTQPMITFNLPESSIVVQLIIISYILILFPSILIQFFPAIRVMEQRYVDPHFTGSKRTWAINLLRGFVMAANIILAVIFGEKFDLFLSLIGSLTCVPLGVSIPGLLHLKLQGRTIKNKIIDIGLITVGILITIMTSGISIYKYIKKDSIG